MLTDDQKTHFCLLGFVKGPAILTLEDIAEFSWRFDAIIANGKDQKSYAKMWAPETRRLVSEQLDVLLVHKDPEFEATESEIRPLKLPYKKQEYD